MKIVQMGSVKQWENRISRFIRNSQQPNQESNTNPSNEIYDPSILTIILLSLTFKVNTIIFECRNFVPSNTCKEENYNTITVQGEDFSESLLDDFQILRFPNTLKRIHDNLFSNTIELIFIHDKKNNIQVQFLKRKEVLTRSQNCLKNTSCIDLPNP